MTHSKVQSCGRNVGTSDVGMYVWAVKAASASAAVTWAAGHCGEELAIFKPDSASHSARLAL